MLRHCRSSTKDCCSRVAAVFLQAIAAHCSGSASTGVRHKRRARLSSLHLQILKRGNRSPPASSDAPRSGPYTKASTCVRQCCPRELHCSESSVSQAHVHCIQCRFERVSLADDAGPTKRGESSRARARSEGSSAWCSRRRCDIGSGQNRAHHTVRVILIHSDKICIFFVSSNAPEQTLSYVG